MAETFDMSAQPRFAFLRYPGGKSLLSTREQIKSYFPRSFSEYREPFIGGGGIFFSLPSAMPRWINDMNPALISLYQSLKQQPAEFIERCRSIPSPSRCHAGNSPSGPNVADTKRLEDLFYNLRDDDTADPAFRYFFLNRCAWGGRVVLEPSRRNRTSFSNPKGWSQGVLGRLEGAARLLKDTKITCDDFASVFAAPGNDVLIYADPPYMSDTEYALSSQLYEKSFSVDDHRRLARCFAQCEHNVVLSYDDHPIIRDLYRDFDVQTASWTYMSSRTKRKGNELIITNFRGEPAFVASEHLVAA